MKRLCGLLLLAAIPVCADLPADPLRGGALHGDPVQQLRLGMRYFTGSANQPRNPELAAYWFRRAAARGNKEAAYNLGYCYEYGIGVRASRLDAYQEYTKAAPEIAAAEFRRALLLRGGMPPESTENHTRPGVSADPVRAREALLRLAERNYAPALRVLAEETLDQPAAERKAADLPLALERLRRAADAKDAPAMRRLADCYYAGTGVPKDDAKMIDWLRRASDAGDPEAAGKLSYCYEYGIGTEIDEKKAFELLRKAAQAGVPMAVAKLGDFYWNGKFVKQSVPEAIKLYRQAAKLGNGFALFRLGACHSEGIGVAKDDAVAANYFLESARLGNADAQYNLAVAYRAGRGIPRDAGAAGYWFRKAAAQGKVDAQREFAIMLLKGEGIAKDEKKALAILQSTAKAGDPVSRKLLRDLAK